jgi:hypothetical protein
MFASTLDMLHQMTKHIIEKIKREYQKARQKKKHILRFRKKESIYEFIISLREPKQWQ